jgi:levansucrase
VKMNSTSDTSPTSSGGAGTRLGRVAGAMLAASVLTFSAAASAQVASTPLMPQTTSWTAEQVRQIVRNDTNTIPEVVAPRDQLMPGYWIWDSWPLRNRDGSIASLNGWTVWMSLTAPDSLLPGQRHDVARIRYMASRDGVNWIPMGLVFPEEGSFGSRNWASDAIYLPEEQQIVVLYTATGDAAENCRAQGERSVCDQPITYEQRIAWAKGGVEADEEGVRFSGWRHKILLEPDGRVYQTPEQTGGQLYAFRDPFYFVDPASGREYLLFEANTAAPGRTGGTAAPGGGAGGGSGSNPGGGSGSAAGSGTNGGQRTGCRDERHRQRYGVRQPRRPAQRRADRRGRIQRCRRHRRGFRRQLGPGPVAHAAAAADLERGQPGTRAASRAEPRRALLPVHRYPHRQVRTRAAAGPRGSLRLGGREPARALRAAERHGLVLGNPTLQRNEFQSYSWFVLPDFSVTSFLDYFNLPPGVNIGNVAAQSSAFQREQFGGTYMPLWHLAVDGDTTEVVVTDVNRDGLTTLDDVRFAKRFTGTREGDANYSRWMDMNRDGRVDQLDVDFIARYALPSEPGQVVNGVRVPIAPPVEGLAAKMTSPPRFKGASPGSIKGTAKSPGR